jgi:hypothetical protein
LPGAPRFLGRHPLTDSRWLVHEGVRLRAVSVPLQCRERPPHIVNSNDR